MSVIPNNIDFLFHFITAYQEKKRDLRITLSANSTLIKQPYKSYSQFGVSDSVYLHVTKDMFCEE